MKQNQIIAIANGEKSKLADKTTAAFHTLQKGDFFEGFTRRYEPFEEDATGANKLPDEIKLVQQTVKGVFSQLYNDTKNSYDAVAALDIGNCSAKADIKLDDGTVIAREVPATHLIWLEKRLVDMRTMFLAIPVVDPAETWTYEAGAGLNKTSEKVAFRTKKTPRVLVKAEATDKHPAQTEVYNEDVNIGKWLTIKHSGAITPAEKAKYLARYEQLTIAVKKAREEANNVDVQTSDIGTNILKYLLCP